MLKANLNLNFKLSQTKHRRSNDFNKKCGLPKQKKPWYFQGSFTRIDISINRLVFWSLRGKTDSRHPQVLKQVGFHLE